jgi:hypothetical protein
MGTSYQILKTKARMKCRGAAFAGVRGVSDLSPFIWGGFSHKQYKKRMKVNIV